MKKQMIVAIAAVSVMSGGGAAAYQHQDFLLAPLRAEQPAPDDGPAYEAKRNTLQAEPCRWWLGFTC